MCKNNDHHLTHEPSNKIVKPTQPGPGTMAKAQSKFPLFSVHNSCISMVTLDPLRVQRAKFFLILFILLDSALFVLKTF